MTFAVAPSTFGPCFARAAPRCASRAAAPPLRATLTAERMTRLRRDLAMAPGPAVAAPRRADVSVAAAAGSAGSEGSSGEYFRFL